MPKKLGFNQVYLGKSGRRAVLSGLLIASPPSAGKPDGLKLGRAAMAEVDLTSPLEGGGKASSWSRSGSF